MVSPTDTTGAAVSPVGPRVIVFGFVALAAWWCWTMAAEAQTAGAPEHESERDVDPHDSLLGALVDPLLDGVTESLAPLLDIDIDIELGPDDGHESHEQTDRHHEHWAAHAPEPAYAAEFAPTPITQPDASAALSVAPPVVVTQLSVAVATPDSAMHPPSLDSPPAPEQPPGITSVEVSAAPVRSGDGRAGFPPHTTRKQQPVGQGGQDGSERVQRHPAIVPPAPPAAPEVARRGTDTHLTDPHGGALGRPKVTPD